MLNEEARRALSKLAINVFTPAMITKLGAYTDLASALSLWPIGANVILWWVWVCVSK
jgi:predicted permease